MSLRSLAYFNSRTLGFYPGCDESDQGDKDIPDEDVLDGYEFDSFDDDPFSTVRPLLSRTEPVGGSILDGNHATNLIRIQPVSTKSVIGHGGQCVLRPAAASNQPSDEAKGETVGGAVHDGQVEIAPAGGQPLLNSPGTKLILSNPVASGSPGQRPGNLDIEAASDVGALLQQPGVLQQHAAVQRDVQLLGGEEHVHEVHVARAGYDEKLGTEPLRLFPLTPESADVTQRLGHGAGQEALTIVHSDLVNHTLAKLRPEVGNSREEASNNLLSVSPDLARPPSLSVLDVSKICDSVPVYDINQMCSNKLEVLTTFDIASDLCDQGLALDESVEVTNCLDSSGQKDCEESNVVIMVDKSPGQRPHHEVTRELVFEENKLSGSERTAESFYRKRETKPETKEVSQCTDHNPSKSCSSGTSSSQLKVSGPQRAGQADNQRRFSSLARSLPSDSHLAPITDMASLDSKYTGSSTRHRAARTSQRGQGVRRTKSALVTGPNTQAAQAVASHSVFLDAGMDRGEAGARCKVRSSLGMSEVSRKEANLNTDKRVFKGSDMDLFTYQEQLEEATKVLPKAGQYLESETKNKKYMLATSASDQSYPVAQSVDKSDPNGSEPYLPKVGNDCERLLMEFEASFANDSNLKNQIRKPVVKKHLDYYTLSGNYVTVTDNDIKSLQGKNYVMEGALEFFLDLLHKKLDPKLQREVHILSSSLFPVMTMRQERGSERILNITENIFSKNAVILPICHRSHWIIAVATRFNIFPDT